MKPERATIRGITRKANSNVVQITVPASVANDLKKINKVTEIVLGRLGHEGCHSGFDLRFIDERIFKFNEKLEQVDIPG